MHMGEKETCRVIHHDAETYVLYTRWSPQNKYIDATDLSLSLKFIDERDGVSDRNAQSGEDAEA